MSESGDRIRTFIAIDLPREVKAFLQSITGSLKKTGADVKWTRPESTHLTLKFLGNIPKDMVRRLDDALKPSLSPLGPVTLQVRGLGAFPSLGRPRVFWIGVRDDDNRLIPMADRVESALEPLGFAREKRPFSPHLTLGRVRSGKGMGDLIDQVRQSMDLEGPGFTADHAVLFQSILKPSGAEYRALLPFPFSGR
jgi:2'-5' RNA ligase